MAIRTLSRPGSSVVVTGGETSRRADWSPTTGALVFGDEFTGSVLDRSKWMTRFAYATGPALSAPYAQTYQAADGTNLPFHGTCQYFNDEQQRYVDEFPAGNVLHKMTADGLKLTSVIDSSDGTVNKYRSAMIQTRYPYYYLPDATKSYYITCKQRLPNVLGTWPADWIIPALNADGSANGGPYEIDRMEGTLNGLGEPNNILHGSSKVQSWVTRKNFPTRLDGVWNGWNYDNKLAPETWVCHPNYDRLWQNRWFTSSVRDIWIEIGLYWTRYGTALFHDGVLVYGELYETKGNDQNVVNKCHLALNLAIGGSWANPSGGNGIEDAKFPCSYDIRSYRVYECPPADAKWAAAVARAGNILPF